MTSPAALAGDTAAGEPSGDVGAGRRVLRRVGEGGGDGAGVEPFAEGVLVRVARVRRRRGRRHRSGLAGDDAAAVVGEDQPVGLERVAAHAELAVVVGAVAAAAERDEVGVVGVAVVLPVVEVVDVEVAAGPAPRHAAALSHGG